MEKSKKLINGVDCDRIVATGYGRNLFEIPFDDPKVTVRPTPEGHRPFSTMLRPCWISAGRKARPLRCLYRKILGDHGQEVGV